MKGLFTKSHKGGDAELIWLDPAGSDKAMLPELLRRGEGCMCVCVCVGKVKSMGAGRDVCVCVCGWVCAGMT